MTKDEQIKGMANPNRGSVGVQEARPVPVQEPVAWLYKGDAEFDGKEWRDNIRVTTSKQVADWQGKDIQPLYTTPPAQPAVPDAFGTREGEHPQYIQGWNDCRAEMLRIRGNT